MGAVLVLIQQARKLRLRARKELEACSVCLGPGLETNFCHELSIDQGGKRTQGIQEKGEQIPWPVMLWSALLSALTGLIQAAHAGGGHLLEGRPCQSGRGDR